MANTEKSNRRGGWPAALGVAVLSGTMLLPSRKSREEVHVVESLAAGHSSAVGIAEAGLRAERMLSQTPATWSSISTDIPSKPYKGQIRPDASGKCPKPGHTLINGGCWIRVRGVALSDCVDDGPPGPGPWPWAHIHKKECYVPAFPPRPATSRRGTTAGDAAEASAAHALSANVGETVRTRQCGAEGEGSSGRDRSDVGSPAGWG